LHRIAFPVVSESGVNITLATAPYSPVVLAALGLTPVWWFFLAIGEEVRQAGSREEP
jgi:hypothetical protein